MLTILCWGGIGDTLRNLSLIPHAWLYRTFGYRCRVVHRNWHDCECLPHAGAPEPEFFQDLIERIPSLVWRGESGEHVGFPRALNRAVRDAIRFLHFGRTRYFPFSVPLSPVEAAALPRRGPGLNIGLQTHLSGMMTKRWGAASWSIVIERILAAHPDCTLRLLDAAPEVETLCQDSRVTSTRRLNVAQSINLIGQLDLLVSIESWTKYIAAWHRIPQIIVVPDMTPEYPGSTASKLSAVELAGIIDQPQNTIIGIEGDRLVLPRIGDLRPEKLVAIILEAMARLPAPGLRKDPLHSAAPSVSPAA